MNAAAHPSVAAQGAQSWRGLYLMAGVCSLAFVTLLLVALTIDFIAPPPVHGGEDTLRFIADNKTLYITEQVLWTLPNALAVVVFVALFIALKNVNQSLALLAATVGILAWGTLLAVPVTSRGSLILVSLSDRFFTAPAADRERYAVAAEAIIAENNTPALVGVLSAVGILVMSFVMVRAPSWRIVGWVGVATGALGVVSEALRHVAPSFYSGYGILLWAWFVSVGVLLIRVGRNGSLASNADSRLAPEQGAHTPPRTSPSSG